MSIIPDVWPRRIGRGRMYTGEATRAEHTAVAAQGHNYICGHPFAGPATMRGVAISSSSTHARRIATPIVPYLARVWAILTASSYATAVVGASSDTTGLTTWTETEEIAIGGQQGWLAEVEIEIGAGSPLTPTYETVHLRVVPGVGSCVLESWGVDPLPIVGEF